MLDDTAAMALIEGRGKYADQAYGHPSEVCPGNVEAGLHNVQLQDTVSFRRHDVLYWS